MERQAATRHSTIIATATSLFAATRSFGWWLRAVVAQQRRGLGTALLLGLLLLSSTLGFFVQNGGVAMAAPVARGLQAGTGAQAANTLSSVNLADQGKVARTLPGQAVKQTSQPKPSPATAIQRPTGVMMRPLLIPLSVGAATQGIGSDGALTVLAPVGVATAAIVAKAQAQAHTEHTHGLVKTATPGGAPVAVQVTQVEGPSGGSASGRVTFGTYVFTVVDVYGQRVPTALARPLQLTYHLPKSWRGAGFEINHTQFVVNGSVPFSALPKVNGRPQSLGKTVAESVTVDTQGGLHSILPLTSSGGGSSGTWNTNAPNAHLQAQTDTGVDLSAGDLTYSYPLDVPPGPGGLTPQLTLAYSSGNVSSNHNQQSASGWLGAGWDLSLGSISWGEHNLSSDCSSCAPTWQDSWQFSDAYGNGGEIIPQDTNVSTWYDDTTNPAPTSPTSDQWFLNDNAQVKIYSYTNPNNNVNFPGNYPVQPPCFRAFLPNGVMEEFGCTQDSLQFYGGDNSHLVEYRGALVSQWNLDMIVDPNGNQIHFTYHQYNANDKNNGGIYFPVDAVPATITYDSPTCHNTTTMCSGSSWQPQAQIIFNSAVSPTRLGGSACPTFTNTTTYGDNVTMRCDDVHDLSNGGQSQSDAAPTLQSLAILNDVQVQVSPSGSAPSWHTLRDYQFSYEQSPSSTPSFDDPTTGQPESIAGYLDLTKIQQVGDDGTTTLPPLTMTYQSLNVSYLDNYYAPAPSGNCGPTWLYNTGQGNGCVLWSIVSGRYLASMSNGQGWTESYTFLQARNNTHGVDTGLTANDPLACTRATLSQQAASPCNEVDDQNWGREVIAARTASVLCVELSGAGCGNSGTNKTTLASSSSYAYFLAGVTKYECTGCAWDMYWGNQNDADKLDFYNAHFMGFQTVDITNPDESLTVDTFDTTDGYGLATSSVTCSPSDPYPCYVAPWNDTSTSGETPALHGRLLKEQDYDTNGTTLLKETDTSYTLTCPPNGVGGSGHNTDPSQQYVGQRTSELDPNDPVIYCESRTASTKVYQVDGGTFGSAPTTTTTNTYTYDGHDHLTEMSANVAASNAATTPHVVTNTWEAWHDVLTITNISASGTYFIEQPAVQDTEDGSGNVKACAYIGYDGGTVGAEGSVSTLTKGLVSETTRYATNCTSGSLSGPISTVRTYNANGDLLATQDADAVAGIAGHTTTSCVYNAINYTACAAYDSLYSSQVASVTNDAQPPQTTGMGYQDTSSSSTTPDPVNGWGQWLTSTTDANSQKTLYEYDPLGRLSASVKPGAAYNDTYSSPTTSYAYPITCPATGTQEPCAALTTTQRLSGSDTVTSATYYDGWGRAVETVTPSSLSGTTCTVSVSYTSYDASGRKVFVSDPYFQSLTNDSSCAPSYVRPDSTQPGTTTAYDGLGRTVKTTDALSNKTVTTYTQGAPMGGANITDSATYEATTTVDANHHQTRALVDGLSHIRYVEHFTGTSSYALYGTTQQNYDWLGNVISVYEPNVGGGGAGLSVAAQSSTTYNLISEETSTTNADLGTQMAQYDPNGNVTETVDARGASGGTVYAGYDGLNRQVWRNTTNSPTGAYVTYTYDQTTGHGFGVGHVTTESFTNGAGGSPAKALAGSHSYTYDERGQVTSQVEMYDAHTYPFEMAYDDAGQSTSLTYSDGELLATGYNAQGWLNQIQTTPSGKASTILATNIGYTGNAGAAMQPTSASIGNGTYTYTATFDTDLRLLEDSLTTTSATLYSATRGYDSVGNVVSEDTQLGAATTTDNQLFCYDEQNRLTWAGATGSSPCNGAVSSGSLTTAYYTQAYTYDAQERLTSAALGSYTYGDPNHPHAVTAIGSGAYSASYDAAGDMTCRAPSSSSTCSGVPTGATLSYDAERRLVQWQNQPSSPTVEADSLYDGEGNRVEQWVDTNGVQTTTGYLLGGVEERSSNGTITKYLGAKGLLMAMRVGSAGSLNYLATNGLGSVSVAVDSNGNVVASTLYAPYGMSRYSSGTMPTSHGFTGQRADATTGLDYYNARYYDPVVGQFASFDSWGQGLDPYGYVLDNPESGTDPTGDFTCQQANAIAFALALWFFMTGCFELQGAEEFADSVSANPIVLVAKNVTPSIEAAQTPESSLSIVVQEVEHGNFTVMVIGDSQSGSNDAGTGLYNPVAKFGNGRPIEGSENEHAAPEGSGPEPANTPSSNDNVQGGNQSGTNSSSNSSSTETEASPNGDRSWMKTKQQEYEEEQNSIDEGYSPSSTTPDTSSSWQDTVESDLQDSIPEPYNADGSINWTGFAEDFADAFVDSGE